MIGVGIATQCIEVRLKPGRSIAGDEQVNVSPTEMLLAGVGGCYAEATKVAAVTGWQTRLECIGRMLGVIQRRRLCPFCSSSFHVTATSSIVRLRNRKRPDDADDKKRGSLDIFVDDRQGRVRRAAMAERERVPVLSLPGRERKKSTPLFFFYLG